MKLIYTWLRVELPIVHFLHFENSAPISVPKSGFDPLNQQIRIHNIRK